MVAVLFEFFLVGVAVAEFLELLLALVELVPVAAGSVAAAAMKKVKTNKFIMIEHLRAWEVSCDV